MREKRNRQASGIFKKDVYDDDKIEEEEREERSGDMRTIATVLRLGINLLLCPFFLTRLSIFARVYLDAICSRQMIDHHQENDTNKKKMQKQREQKNIYVPYSHCIE